MRFIYEIQLYSFTYLACFPYVRRKPRRCLCYMGTEWESTHPDVCEQCTGRL